MWCVCNNLIFRFLNEVIQFQVNGVRDAPRFLFILQPQIWSSPPR